MFRHTGSHRTLQHNIRLAALLSLTAGLVNVIGFQAFSVLTTNVTGHVAVFAQQLARGEIVSARVVCLWMFMFWMGAFLSSLIVNTIFHRKQYAYVIPILTEIIILAFIAREGQYFNHTLQKTEFFAGSLLFAMGMQNALVSTISGSVVRTTHLTGIFTDLGIEIAALFNNNIQQRKQLNEGIRLKLIIITCFFLGGIIGGYLYSSLRYYTFYIPSSILMVGLLYDALRFKLIKIVRRLKPIAG